MTTGELRLNQERCERCSRDPVRRVILMVLAIYLAPVALVVLLIGSLGLACCAVVRWIEDSKPSAVEDRMRRDTMAHGLAAPHLQGMARSRSTG
mgnify:CR=1 FL=1